MGPSALGVVIAATEQSPEKLGPDSCRSFVSGLPGDPAAKTDFSCASCGGIFTSWEEAGIQRVLLCGIETHVCVQQTAIDLAAAGYQVFLAVDAVGSRFQLDHETALRRLEASGATLTTTEAALFEWCGGADNPAFKAISSLAKEAVSTRVIRPSGGRPSFHTAAPALIFS